MHDPEIRKALKIIGGIEQTLPKTAGELDELLGRLATETGTLQVLIDTIGPAGPEACGMSPAVHRVMLAAIEFARQGAATRIIGSLDDPKDLAELIEGAADNAATIRALHRQLAGVSHEYLGMPADLYAILLAALEYAWKAGAAARAMAHVYGLKQFIARRQTAGLN